MSDTRPSAVCIAYSDGRRAPDFDGLERPWRLLVYLAPPAGAELIFAIINGGWEIIEFAGVDHFPLYEALMDGIPDVDDGEPLPRHPRFRKAVIVGPDGSEEGFDHELTRAISRERNPR